MKLGLAGLWLRRMRLDAVYLLALLGVVVAVASALSIQILNAVPSAGIALEVKSLLPDQENRASLARGLFYWEGMVTVRDAAGATAGGGYVELTGFGDGSRPPI